MYYNTTDTKCLLLLQLDDAIWLLRRFIMEILKISRSVYMQICNTLGKNPPECGGVLGARENDQITEFYFDETGKSSSTGYAPDVVAINNMLVNDWMPNGILMVGIVHSHANQNKIPSCMDVEYGIRILRALDTVDEFYIPIVTVHSLSMISTVCFRRFGCASLFRARNSSSM